MMKKDLLSVSVVAHATDIQIFFNKFLSSCSNELSNIEYQYLISVLSAMSATLTRSFYSGSFNPCGNLQDVSHSYLAEYWGCDND